MVIIRARDFENKSGLFMYQMAKISPKKPCILARQFMVVYLRLAIFSNP
jgi:hypothetical protein